MAATGVAQLQAQGSAQGQRMRDLNSQVLNLYSRLQQGSASNASALRGQAQPVLEQRAAALADLMSQDPKQALSLAFPSDLIANLTRAFPQAASRLEVHGSWAAPADYYVIDDAALRTHRSEVKMKVGDEELKVYFAGNLPAGLTCGSLLEVKGIRLDTTVAADGGTVQATAFASAPCSPTGVQNTAILLVTFPGVTPPAVTPQSAESIFFSSTNRSVSGYWQDASAGKTSATGHAFGWFTLDRAYSCDEYGAMFNAAILAADSTVDFTLYRRVFLVFPDPPNCSFAGLGTIGCAQWVSPSKGTFSASAAWLIGSLMTNQDYGVLLAAHEGGHNLTLNHASSRGFSPEALGSLGATGTLQEYGDYFSAMGSWNYGHYSAAHKVQMGWFAPNTDYTTVQSGGSYTLLPFETGGSGLKALKVQRGTGNNAWLWIEYRQPIGQYESTISPQVFSGALIHYEDSQTINSYTHLLDFTPSTSSWYDPALAAGQTWKDPYSDLSLSVGSATSTGLGISINYGGGGTVTPTCVAGPPVVTMSPTNPSGSAGSSVSYSVTVTNTDSSACASSGFTLGANPPAGWGSAFSSPALTLSPGQSGSTTLSLSIPAGAAAGTYPVSLTASDAAYSGSASANCSVVTTAPPPPQPATLSAVIQVPGGPYSTKSIVPMKVIAVSDTAAAAGATVQFSLRKANGATVVYTVQADASGTASWNYRLARQDPKGTYYVSAQVTYGSATAATGTATFTVQ